jgi:hypothetical protein
MIGKNSSGSIWPCPATNRSFCEARRIRAAFYPLGEEFPLTAILNHIDVNGVFPYLMAACNQFYDAADIAADIANAGDGKPILHVPSNQFLVIHTDNLKKLPVIPFEVALGSRRRAVQLILQRILNLYPDEQSLSRLSHYRLSLIFFIP